MLVMIQQRGINKFPEMELGARNVYGNIDQKKENSEKKKKKKEEGKFWKFNLVTHQAASYTSLPKPGRIISRALFLIFSFYDAQEKCRYMLTILP